MKHYFAIVFFLVPFFAHAQTISFVIEGKVNNTEHAKFAYLTTTTQQVTIASPKIFTVVPIIDGKFEFKGTFDLEKNGFQHACIIIEERGNISKQEADSKFKQLIWISGREKNMKIIILEDMTLAIEEKEQAISSSVTANGILTKQLEAKSVAVRAKNRKLLEFIKTYNDSPFAFYVVKEWAEPGRNPEIAAANYGSPIELFNALSERLKNSEEGKSLKKLIDDQQ